MNTYNVIDRLNALSVNDRLLHLQAQEQAQDRQREIDKWLESERVYEVIDGWLVDDSDKADINEVIERGLKDESQN